MLICRLWVWILASEGHVVPRATGSHTAQIDEEGDCPFHVHLDVSRACKRLWKEAQNSIISQQSAYGM